MHNIANDSTLPLEYGQFIRVDSTTPPPLTPHSLYVTEELATVCDCDSHKDASAWQFAAVVCLCSTLLILSLLILSLTF
jgi:hypothetical protein